MYEQERWDEGDAYGRIFDKVVALFEKMEAIIGDEKLTVKEYAGILDANKITQYAEQLAESQHATGMQDIILNTEQAYWQVISLINKKKLAQSYLQLVSQLDLSLIHICLIWKN